ncbi:hypothetical protein ACXR2U_11505 [Jatrophihabitans sp. YIM 134969]
MAGSGTTGATGTSLATPPRSRLLPGARRTESGEVVRNASRRTEHSAVWSWLVLGGTVAAGVLGALLVALAVRRAGHGGSGTAALTWLGLAVAVLPAALVVCARDATAAARWTALATVAVVTLVPVGLRSGAGPTTTGDLLRYAQLADLRLGGRLLPDRLPAVVTDQPGLAALTTAVWRVSGLTVWHSALVVVAVAHVTAVVGVRGLARALGLGERTAVLAAVVWSVGPAVLVATSRVSGTTLGLALLLWALAAVVQAATAATPAPRLAWTVTGVGLAAATAVSDLAAAWTLVGLTLLVGAVTAGVTAPPVAGRDVRRAWWPVAVGVMAVTVLWSVAPPGRSVLGDLAGLGAEHHRVWPTGPVEVALAVLAVVLGLALAGLGASRLRGRLNETGPRLGLVVGALFPISLLGLAAAPTATLAVLLWPVLTAALAPFVAAGVLVVWDLGARRTRSAAPERSVSGALRHAQRDTRAGVVARSGPPRTVSPDGRGGTTPPTPVRRDRRVPLPVAAIGAVLAVALVTPGATAATTPSAAEPSGPVVATGTASTTEVLAVAARLADLAGPDFRFAASDPEFGAVVATLSGGTLVPGVLPATRGAADLPGSLRDADVGWLLVTDAVDGATPVDGASLALDPGLVRVLTTPSATVYRVRPAVPGASRGSDSPSVVPAAGS